MALSSLKISRPPPDLDRVGVGMELEIGIGIWIGIWIGVEHRRIKACFLLYYTLLRCPLIKNILLKLFSKLGNILYLNLANGF